jgi:cytidyltransferase-like protein
MYDPSVEISDPKLEAAQAAREANMASTGEASCDGEGVAVAARYHIGYVSGVFDLFHVGHLNLLERAKTMCDYLIVEVVSDEAVRRDKKVDAYIPLKDRLRIVQSLKCVDEAHVVPIEAPGPADAWRRYHFDVQFRGSDYADNEGSKNEREFLRKHGAELVIFPYTESVSSTKLREMVRKK